MEEFAFIISFFAGALAAKNWPWVKRAFVFGEEQEDAPKRKLTAPGGVTKQTIVSNKKSRPKKQKRRSRKAKTKIVKKARAKPKNSNVGEARSAKLMFKKDVLTGQGISSTEIEAGQKNIRDQGEEKIASALSNTPAAVSPIELPLVVEDKPNELGSSEPVKIVAKPKSHFWSQLINKIENKPDKPVV